MADDPSGDQLHQMAEHRGLKLVKSRRRKPGVGDFGMFGLTDGSGKALLGIGADGLTATAADIESYLRSGTLNTWQESASAEPDKPAARAKPRPTAEADEPPTKRAKAAPAAPPPPKPRPVEPAEPPPEPELAIRPAKSSDATAVAKLLSQLSGITLDADTARRNLAAVQKAEGGLLLAELNEAVGCCGWAIVQTLHHGPIGRITVLIVDQKHRRRGIATRMLAAAEQALADAGCSIIEAMSDIEIDNAHNFFRSLKFEQASYRFTRKPVEEP
jgi:ribosomal protein S18 acetylase RimI-like enzyme